MSSTANERSSSVFRTLKRLLENTNGKNASGTGPTNRGSNLLGESKTKTEYQQFLKRRKHEQPPGIEKTSTPHAIPNKNSSSNSTTSNSPEDVHGNTPNSGRTNTPCPRSTRGSEESEVLKSSEESCDNLLLKNWGLPEAVLNKYNEVGITSMFPWQVECLSLGNVLQGSNLVYSAPTSAGKTLVAEILMLKRVLETKRKAIIILPFVSVAREKMMYLRRLFRGAGVRVDGYIGPHHPPGGWKMVDVAVCTIEKANSLVNRLMEENQLHQVGVLVVDELHMLGDSSRGYLLELLVTKVRFMSWKLSQSRTENPMSIQIVGMSATLPNLDLLAKWLEAELYRTDFRPVPLTEYIKIGKSLYSTDFKMVRTLNDPYQLSAEDSEDVIQLCLETVSAGHSVLVFCPSRKRCEILASAVATEIFNIGKSSPSDMGPDVAETKKRFRSMLSTEKIEEVLEFMKSIPVGLDSVLAETISYGTAFHHAGLTFDERDIIEAAFKKGAVKVLMATSTLSSGVNLPARRVIIRSPLNGANVLMDVLSYRQMIGRAGRKGIDTEGESILICKATEKQRGKALVKSGLKPVKSCLANVSKGLTTSMKRAVLEVIASGVASSPAEVQQYCDSTLLAAAAKYGGNEKSTNVIEACLNFLMDNEFIICHTMMDNGNAKKYVPTSLGNAIMASSFSPDDGLIIYSELDKARREFVLENELHIVYQVTPLHLASQWPKLDWLNYLNIWEKLSADEKRVGALVGVEERILVKFARTEEVKCSNLTSVQYRQLAIHRRFYAALALYQLVKEADLKVVAMTFKCDRGMLQTLQQNASSFAGMVTTFCNRLGWANMEILLSEFQSRLNFGIQRELCDLVRLPLLNGLYARWLFNGGIEDLSSLAHAKVSDVETIFRNSRPFETEKRRENETLSELKERRKSKCVLLTGRSGMTETEAARLLITEARQLVEKSLGANVCWNDMDSTSSSSDQSDSSPSPNSEKEEAERLDSSKSSTVKFSPSERNRISSSPHETPLSQRLGSLCRHNIASTTDDNKDSEAVTLQMSESSEQEEDDDGKSPIASPQKFTKKDLTSAASAKVSFSTAFTAASVASSSTASSMKIVSEKVRVEKSLVDLFDSTYYYQQQILQENNTTFDEDVVIIDNQPTENETIKSNSVERRKKLSFEPRDTPSPINYSKELFEEDLDSPKFLQNLVNKTSTPYVAPLNKNDITMSSLDLDDSAVNEFMVNYKTQLCAATFAQEETSKDSIDFECGQRIKSSSDSNDEEMKTVDQDLFSNEDSSSSNDDNMGSLQLELSTDGDGRIELLSSLGAVESTTFNNLFPQNSAQNCLPAVNKSEESLSTNNDTSDLNKEVMILNNDAISLTVRGGELSTPVKASSSSRGKSCATTGDRRSCEFVSKGTPFKQSKLDFSQVRRSAEKSALCENVSRKRVFVNDDSKSPISVKQAKKETTPNKSTQPNIFKSLKFRTPVKCMKFGVVERKGKPPSRKMILEDKLDNSSRCQSSRPKTCPSVFTVDICSSSEESEDDQHSENHISDFDSDNEGSVPPIFQSCISKAKEMHVANKPIDFIDVTNDKIVFRTFVEEWKSQKRFSLGLACEKMVVTPETRIGSKIKGVEVMESTPPPGSSFIVEDRMLAVVGVAISWDFGDVYYISLSDKQADCPIPDPSLSISERIEALKSVLSQKSFSAPTAVVYNLREQIRTLFIGCGILMTCPGEDPKIGAWLLNPVAKEFTVKDLINSYLTVNSLVLSGINGKIGTHSLGMHVNSFSSPRLRAATEVNLNHQLMDSIREKLELTNLYKVFKDVEMKCVYSLAKMELVGIGISAEECQNLIATIDSKMYDLQVEAYRHSGYEFSLSSRKAVAKVLYVELRLQPNTEIQSGSRKTASSSRGRKNFRAAMGYNTKKDTLEKLKNVHELPGIIIEWRKLSHTKNKCLALLVREKRHSSQLGMDRIFGVSQYFTVTGRVSMYEPNVQNVPRYFSVQTEFNIQRPSLDRNLNVLTGGAEGVKNCVDFNLRKAFVASEGYVLLSADYSQLELRILAHLSLDKVLLSILNDGGDVLKRIAAQWKGIDPSQVTSTERQQAKQICYGMLYGMGSHSLGDKLEVDDKEAKKFMANFKAKYPAVDVFIQNVVHQCSQLGYVTTLNGRRRYLPSIKSSNYQACSHAERQAINTTVQGSAADLFKTAIVSIDKKLDKIYIDNSADIAGRVYKRKARLVLQLHDELIYEVADECLNEVATIVKQKMETQTRLSVKLPVSLKVGPSWGELREFDVEF